MIEKQELAVVRFNNSRSSHAFAIEESLWEEEIQRMLVLVHKHVQAIAAPPPTRDSETRTHRFTRGKYNPNLANLSIALLGTYGSGKSSLMRTFVKRIREEDPAYFDQGAPFSHLRGKLFALDIIEPNLFQKRPNEFLYAFLAMALEEDLDKNLAGGGNPHDAQILSPVQQQFQEVSEYLQALDDRDIGGEYDPLGISLERLDRHSSNLRLKRDLHKFFDTLTDHLAGSKDSLLFVPVDDADMSLDGLVYTLDTLRRFMQHPRIVPIFSFTGRLAEELLQVHYGETLKNHLDKEKLSEASTNLNITESLAIQHLGKLFPVANRIKLGPGAARLQTSWYRIQSQENRKAKIFRLLEGSSRILFGCPEWPVLPVIRSPLRSSTLRRQLHIADAMEAANIGEWIPSGDKAHLQWDGPENPQISWARMFDSATWALLNVHRDVLKEHRLYLDDLYSWTPLGLQKVVLDGILSMRRPNRQRLIKLWRYRTEDRRSQMISLLAANVFRPRMQGEEPRGDDPNSALFATFKPAEKPSKNNAYLNISFSIRKGSLWFLQLWIGFYLPQILLRNRNPKEDRKPAFSGVGWNINSGAAHAIREALNNGTVQSTGMLFLDPIALTNSVKKILSEEESPSDLVARKSGEPGKQLPWTHLLLELWSFYGSHDGGIWSAISLWRGLSLFAVLLKSDIDFIEKKRITRMLEAASETKNPDFENQGRPNFGERSRSHHEATDDERKERISEIKAILYRHIKNARVIGSAPLENQCFQTDKSLNTYDEFINFGNWRIKNLDRMITALAEDIYHWLARFPHSAYRIKPMAPTSSETALRMSEHNRHDKGTSEEDRKKRAKNEQERSDWKACFIRRIHGDALLGSLWQDLDHASVKELEQSWTAKNALMKWIHVISKYWDCGREFYFDDHVPNPSQNLTQTLIIECPFIKPFVIDFDKIDQLKADWEHLFEKTSAYKKDLPTNTDQRLEELFREISQSLRKLDHFPGEHPVDYVHERQKTDMTFKKKEKKCRKLLAKLEDLLAFNHLRTMWDQKDFEPCSTFQEQAQVIYFKIVRHTFEAAPPNRETKNISNIIKEIHQNIKEQQIATNLPPHDNQSSLRRLARRINLLKDMVCEALLKIEQNSEALTDKELFEKLNPESSESFNKYKIRWVLDFPNTPFTITGDQTTDWYAFNPATNLEEWLAKAYTLTLVLGYQLIALAESVGKDKAVQELFQVKRATDIITRSAPKDAGPANNE